MLGWSSSSSLTVGQLLVEKNQRMGKREFNYDAVSLKKHYWPSCFIDTLKPYILLLRGMFLIYIYPLLKYAYF